MADDLVAPSLKRSLNFAFHAKELWHGEGFFPRENWSRERRLEILGHLADIPQKFHLPIIYSCVKRSKYPPKNPPANSPKRVFRRAQREATKRCHTICFLSCLEQVERWMECKHQEEKVFVVHELHENHKADLSEISKFFSNPRARSTIENDPDINWSALTHLVEEPLFVRKSGSSLVQIADVCAFILSRALAEKEHSKPLLEKIRPNLVSGFLCDFFQNKGDTRSHEKDKKG